MDEPNPFIHDDPVPPEELVNRDEEARKLLSLAAGGHNSRLQAPRRYGKTSLLLRVLRDADRGGFRHVYVDFLAVSTPAEVARRLEDAYRKQLTGGLSQLLSRLVRSWRPRAKIAPGGLGGEFEYAGATETNQRLADLLDLPPSILKKSGDRTIVVFDEFQDFLRAGGDLAGLLRSKIQLHGEAASYIFCGSEQAYLEAQFSDRKKPLFDQARPLYLDPLSDQDLGDYISERFTRTDRDAGEALDLLLDIVRGHPQRAMLVAHHLWERTPRGSAADGDVLAAALRSIDRETRERFETTWQAYAANPNMRRVLKALALSPETLYNRRTLAAFSLNKGQAASGEKALRKVGEIHEVDEQPQIIDPLFERWLQETARRETS